MGSAERLSVGSRYLSAPGPENPDIQVAVMAVIIYRIEKFLYLYGVIETVTE